MSENLSEAEYKSNGLTCLLEQPPREIRYGWYYFFHLSRFRERERSGEDKKNVWQWMQMMRQVILVKGMNFIWENRKFPKITHLTFHLLRYALIWKGAPVVRMLMNRFSPDLKQLPRRGFWQVKCSAGVVQGIKAPSQAGNRTWQQHPRATGCVGMKDAVLKRSWSLIPWCQRTAAE